MQMPPLSEIASWPPANYDNPVTTGAANVVITCLFYPLIPTTAFMICALIGEWRCKWNRHIWDVKLDTVISGLKLVVTSEILFSLSTTLTKLSMLVLVYRIVKEGTKTFHRVVIGVMIFLILECLAFIITVLFQCGSPSAYWTITFEPQHCISEAKNTLAAGINNTIGDVAVVLLPIPLIWRLKLPFQQQIIIFVLFGAGFLVTVASIMRTYYLYKVNTTWDKTWVAMPAWISSSVELYLGIICASIPATKKFFSRISPKIFGASAFSQYGTKSRTTDRHSVAAPQNVELGDYAGYASTEDKDDKFDDPSPASPSSLHPAESRPQTSMSSASAAWSGTDDVTRVDCDDKIVDRRHHSPLD
ncbi:uncharacterized protein RAG0_02028 [Rhynchosporium agropyri]|uniref:Rhodopsin domain-containing protein n=1 Tax=Rhynchosporium agropyri TaxID=914238 RepID=A0A1E1JZU8_9HELO|nr:uncharacterized protein RAG0_02028 [Rhynchosporium agropyri]